MTTSLIHQIRVAAETYAQAIREALPEEDPIYVHIVAGHTQHGVLHVESLADVPLVGDTLRMKDRHGFTFLTVTGRELNMVQGEDTTPARLASVTLWVKKEKSP